MSHRKVLNPRTKLYIACVCAAVAVGGAAGSASARVDGSQARSASPVVIKIATALPATGPNTTALKVVANVLNQRSHGQIQLQVYPSGQLGTISGTFDELKANTVQMGMQNPVTTSSLMPAIGLFAAPYLLNSPAAVLRGWKSPIGQKLGQQFQTSQGLHLLPPWRVGTWDMILANKPVRSCQDLQGTKLRVPPSPVLSGYMSICGATPVAMDFSEVYLALKTGTVDGLPQPLTNIPGAKLYEVAKDVTLTNQLYDIFFPIINVQTWNELTPGQQNTVLYAFAVGRKINDNLIDQTQSQALQLIRQNGGQVITPTKAELATWINAAHRLWSQMAPQWGGMKQVTALAKAGNTVTAKKPAKKKK